MAEFKMGPFALAASGVAGIVVILIASGILSVYWGDVSHYSNLNGIGTYLVAIGVIVAVVFVSSLMIKSQSRSR